MKLLSLIGTILMTTALQASPGRYEGTGSISIPGKQARSYSSTIVVEETEKDGKVVRVQETYTMGEGKPQTFVSTFHMNEDGTLKVRRNGEVVGCGYCKNLENGSHWCDYHVQTEQGRLHVNSFYDGAKDELYRLGDMIQLDGVHVWSDKFTKKK